VVVCYPQHPLTRRHSVPLEALRGEPFVAFQAGLKIREEIDRVLALHRIPIRVALEFDNIETIKRAIEIGAGISLLPEPTIAREIESGTLVQVEIEGRPLVRPLGIIHRRDRKLSETAQQFIELLQSESSRIDTEESAVAAVGETNGRNGKPSRKKAPVSS
jgi:DNA-binding transcriptional LysR family regulator